jgi:hypothetical protein
MSTVGLFVDDVLYLAQIVFSVLAVLRVLRGIDAELPFISKMTDGDIAAAIKPKVQTAAASVHTAPPVQPAPAVRLCPACSAPLHENSRLCTKCGAKAE